jgi:hypothetical protein
MLETAVAAVKVDKAKALDMFNKGEGGFLDRELYVFCDNVSNRQDTCPWQPLSEVTPCSRVKPLKMINNRGESLIICTHVSERFCR